MSLLCFCVITCNHPLGKSLSLCVTDMLTAEIHTSTFGFLDCKEAEQEKRCASLLTFCPLDEPHSSETIEEPA